jgi:competence protein ComEC
MPPRRASASRTWLLVSFVLALLVVAFLVLTHEPPPRPEVIAPSPAPTEAPGTGVLRITFVDVEQGDAILIQLGETDILVDAGPREACSHLSEVLQRVHGELELFLITHPHDDHYGCGTEVLRQHEVARLITNGEGRGPPRDKRPQVSWSRFEEEARRARLTPEHLRVGDVLTPAPGLSLKVLATGSPEGGAFPDTSSGEDINNDSLVFMLEYAGRRVLFTGDIEVAQGRRPCGVLQWSCPALQADVLKVPHHGSADFAPEFFRAVHPAWAVISADYANQKHHLPRARTIGALEAEGARILSTSAEGTEDVTLRITPQGELSWQAPGAPVFAWDGKKPKLYRQ